MDETVINFTNLIILVRADPIICGHSTEARNLAEAAMASGFRKVDIVSYPIGLLEESGLPLKPLESVPAYSPGIEVHRPEPIGDYKVLDGRVGLGITGKIVDLLHAADGPTIVMDLYLVPHGRMVMDAVRTFRASFPNRVVVTVGEAVGSDVTNVVSNAIAAGSFGAAQSVLANLLEHDVPVAVSEYTKEVIVAAARDVDAASGTALAAQLEDEVEVVYPAIDTKEYLGIRDRPAKVDEVLERYGLERGEYVLFLSRVAPAKGVSDLVEAFRRCKLRGHKTLVIAGAGPLLDHIGRLAANDPDIRVLGSVSEAEKQGLMYACYAYALPSKPCSEFTETFGIALAEKMLAGGGGLVITTDTGGIPEATGGYCIEHQAGDIASLTVALNHVEEMGEGARGLLAEQAQIFAKQFDRSVALARIVKLASAEAEHPPAGRVEAMASREELAGSGTALAM